MNDNRIADSTTAVGRYRYGAQMADIEGGCPKNAHSNFGATVFRAVHKDTSKESYLPYAVLDGGNPKECCHWGLSMYDSLPKMKARFSKVMKVAPNFLRRVGDHYAELALTGSHGRRTNAKAGHFTFFEYDTFVASACVQSSGSLGL
jgi:hypothetical protein